MSRLDPEVPLSCCGAATTSVALVSGVASVASGLADVPVVAVAVGLAPAPGRVDEAAGVAEPDEVDGALGAAVRAAALGAAADDRGVEPAGPLVPGVPAGAEVVRRGVLVGFGAAVVGLGAAVVGFGAETVAGATLGLDPPPNRKPTEDPGLGFQPLMPIWL